MVPAGAALLELLLLRLLLRLLLQLMLLESTFFLDVQKTKWTSNFLDVQKKILDSNQKRKTFEIFRKEKKLLMTPTPLILSIATLPGRVTHD